MKLFIQVYFWFALLAIFLRIIMLAHDSYPRSLSRATDAWSLAIAAPFLFWAWYLVWG